MIISPIESMFFKSFVQIEQTIPSTTLPISIPIDTTTKNERGKRIEILADYDIDSMLGQGSTGQVFAARRKSDGLPVAIKFLNRVPLASHICRQLFQ